MRDTDPGRGREGSRDERARRDLLLQIAGATSTLIVAILDLDGVPPPPRRRRSFEVPLAFVTAFLVAGFFVTAPHWPRGWTRRAELPPVVLPNAFSILDHASPAPSRTLALPVDLGTVIQQRGPNGETGLIARDTAITMVRLRGGDVVAFGRVPPSSPRGRPITVRGVAGVAFSDGGLHVVRWTENGASYEISSRTLDADRLVEIARLLR